LREGVLAERSAFLAASDKNGPAALHDCRVMNRLDVVVIERNVVLRHVRQTIEAAGTERRGVA
jgi:hypothetical protein